MLLVAAVLFLVSADGASGVPAASAAPAYVVVLRDGTRYALARPYEIKGSQARLPLTSGVLVAVRASDVDVEASRRATEAVNAPPPPAPTPTSPTLASAAAASTASKKASKTITIEGKPGEAQGVTTSSSAAPSGTPYPTASAGARGGRSTLGDSGGIRVSPAKAGTPAPPKK